MCHPAFLDMVLFTMEVEFLQRKKDSSNIKTVKHKEKKTKFSFKLLEIFVNDSYLHGTDTQNTATRKIYN